MYSFNDNQWENLSKKGYRLEVEVYDSKTKKSLDTLPFKNCSDVAAFFRDNSDLKIGTILRNELEGLT